MFRERATDRFDSQRSAVNLAVPDSKFHLSTGRKTDIPKLFMVDASFEGGGEGKKNSFVPSSEEKNGFFARETLNFLLNFLKEVKRVFTGKNSRRNCECAKWNMDRDSISFPFEAKLHRSEVYNTYGFRKTRFRF